MCGRFTLIANAEQLKEHFELKQAAASLIPRYNIAPSQFIVIIKKNILDFAAWGFKIPNFISNNIINAKIETILEKKCFNLPFKKQRCLIPANGFFEWKTVGRSKVPFYIQTQEQGILGFGGIIIKDCCVILTTNVDRNRYKDAIHNRMPIVIKKSNYNLWLNEKAPINLLLNSEMQVAQEDFYAYPVSSQVNNPNFDNIMCIKSLD